MIPPSICQPWQTDRSGPMPESTATTPSYTTPWDTIAAAWWRDGPALPALTFGTGPPDGDPCAESVRRARLSVGTAPLLNDINRAVGGRSAGQAAQSRVARRSGRYGNQAHNPTGAPIPPMPTTIAASMAFAATATPIFSAIPSVPSRQS